MAYGRRVARARQNLGAAVNWCWQPGRTGLVVRSLEDAMRMDPEQLDAFQARMSAWVGKQGFLFQLTHAGGVQGAGGSVLGALLLRVLWRLGLVGLLVLACGWVYVLKRPDFEAFREEIEAGLVSGLGVEVEAVKGVSRKEGNLEIGQIVMEGGEDSFFEEARVRGLRTKMGLLDGLSGTWDGMAVSMEMLSIEVRAGAESDVLGRRIFERLLAPGGGFEFAKIEAEAANISWGYSTVTRGAIRDASLLAMRTRNGWNVIITGGTLSQNWLKRMKIERIRAEIHEGGIEFKEMRLRRGLGELNLAATLRGAASNPQLRGEGSFRSLPVESLVVSEVRDYVGGTISGTLELGGSPYGQEGVRMKAAVYLDDGDRVELRDRFPLLRAISVVDRFRSYKNVRFTDGRFNMETGGEQAVFSEIWLHAQEVMRIEGEFVVRRPTEKEVSEFLNIEERRLLDDPLLSREDTEFLEEHATGSMALGDLSGDGGPASFGRDSKAPWRDEADEMIRRLTEQARLRQVRAPVIEGALRIGVNRKAFARTVSLAEMYPVDAQTGLRWIDLALQDNLYGIGSELAKDIYDKTRVEQ